MATKHQKAIKATTPNKRIKNGPRKIDSIKEIKDGLNVKVHRKIKNDKKKDTSTQHKTAGDGTTQNKSKENSNTKKGLKEKPRGRQW